MTVKIPYGVATRRVLRRLKKLSCILAKLPLGGGKLTDCSFQSPLTRFVDGLYTPIVRGISPLATFQPSICMRKGLGRRDLVNEYQFNFKCLSTRRLHYTLPKSIGIICPTENVLMASHFYW